MCSRSFVFDQHLVENYHDHDHDHDNDYPCYYQHPFFMYLIEMIDQNTISRLSRYSGRQNCPTTSCSLLTALYCFISAEDGNLSFSLNYFTWSKIHVYQNSSHHVNLLGTCNLQHSNLTYSHASKFYNHLLLI